jgi:hypothetical protein
MTPPRKRHLRIDDPLAPTTQHDPNAKNTAADANVGADRLRELALEQIHPNPDQPRKHFEETSLASLADSIRERGVLQPIIVRPLDAGGYQLAAGERRWRAAQLAGKATIPALIDATERAQTPQEGLMATTVEAQPLSMQLDRIHVPGCSRTDTAASAMTVGASDWHGAFLSGL